MALGSFALNVLKSALSFVTTPGIGLPCSLKQSVATLANVEFSMLTPLLMTGVPIWCDKYKEINQNQIGTQVVVGSALNSLGATQVVTENIAPLPRKWQFSGYIALGNDQLIDTAMQAEMHASAAFASAGAVANTLVISAIKQYCRHIRDSRSAFWFRTREGEIVKALIEEVTFTDDASITNAQPVSFSVMEYRALTLVDITKGASISTAAANMPTMGSVFGNAANMATMVASAVSTGANPLLVAAFIPFAKMQEAWHQVKAAISSGNVAALYPWSLVPIKGTRKELGSLGTNNFYSLEINNSAQSEYTTKEYVYTGNWARERSALYGLSASLFGGTQNDNDDYSTASLLDNANHPSINVAQKPFASIVYKNDIGEIQYYENVKATISLNSGHGIEITLSRTDSNGSSVWLAHITGTFGTDTDGNTITMDRFSVLCYNTLMFINDECSVTFTCSSYTLNDDSTFDELDAQTQATIIADTNVAVTE